MAIEYDIKKINFIREGKGKKVLLLHGWMANIKSFQPVFEKLSKNFDTIALDFPGFGKSEMPPVTWDIYDYAKIIYQFVIENNFYPCTIIGHSFGGRVAIIIGSRYSNIVDKIILVDSAGLKPKRNLKYYLKIYSYKLIKNSVKLICIILKKDFNSNIQKVKEKLNIKGSSDYENSKDLKDIFVKVVNQDLKEDAKKINKPTLIIWGDKDYDTPLYMAKKLNKLIKDSGIVILENAGHYSYLDQFSKFINVVNYFINLN